MSPVGHGQGTVKRLIALLLLALAAAPLMAATAPSPNMVGRCIAPELMRDAEVVLLSMYGGAGARPDFLFYGEDHAPHVVSVEGARTGKPLVLVMAAYEPTVWDVSRVPADRLRAVVTYGHHAQGVAGARDRTKVFFGGRQDGAATSPACGQIDYAYEAADLRRSEAEVAMVLGRRPARTFAAYEAVAFDVDDGTPKAAPSPVPAAAVLSAVPAVPLATFWNAEQIARWRTLDSWGVKKAVRGLWSGDGSSKAWTRVRSVSASNPEHEERTGSGLGVPPSLWMVLTAFGYLALIWLRRKRGAAPAEAEQAATPDARWDAVIVDRRTLDALTRFRSAASVAKLHPKLDEDLADEATTIAGPRYEQLEAALRRAAASTGGGEQVEAPFRDALDLLTRRLADIAAEQAKRDVDALRTNGRFIAARYPGEGSI